MNRLVFDDGICRIDGVESDFATWEYPYFRDSAGNWASRLAQLRRLGARVVSSYVPWRHHEVANGEHDFDGHTQPNRDLRGFIAQCADAGLLLMLKPGPFCHAELNYGGLPDRVCPLRSPAIAPELDAAGEPVTWWGSTPGERGEMPWWPLPSPHDPGFTAESDTWLRAVREVLSPAARDGVLVAVQVGNEGVYTDAAQPIWAHDYSAPALDAYRDWLRDIYGDLNGYNQAHRTRHETWQAVSPPRRYEPVAEAADLLGYQDWSRWRRHALTALYQHWRGVLDLPVETLVNVNPPRSDAWGIDAWLARVHPAGWGQVRYGYTNWIGIAAEDDSALARYMFLTRVRRGPNIEENWGFSGQYDPRYEHANVCFQQTLVAVAGGATGINVYTAVGTDDWDAGLDAFQPRPYPAHAPIGPDGATGVKATVVADLFAYLARFGAELAGCDPVGGVAWGVDTDAATWAAWAGEDGVRIGGRHWPAPGRQYLAAHAALTRAGIDLDVVDLADGDLNRFAAIVVAGVPMMAETVRRRLAEYTGRVLVLGDPPETLSDIATVVGDADQLAGLLTRIGGVTPVPRTGDALVWLRRHPVHDIQHVIVVTRDDSTVQIRLPGDEVLTITAAPESGALVRLADGRVDAALIRGSSERRGLTGSPSALWRDSTFRQPSGDLLILPPNL